jgi:hypothetical protein
MELNLTTIVRRVRRAGVHAYLAQTGGGVATIYAGPVRVEGDAEYYAVAAGPGWFEGAGWRNGRADDAEFTVGRDNDGSDTNGPYLTCNGMSEDAIADWIVRRAKEAME